MSQTEGRSDEVTLVGVAPTVVGGVLLVYLRKVRRGVDWRVLKVVVPLERSLKGNGAEGTVMRLKGRWRTRSGNVRMNTE